jgi:putative ABC transport system ATP-binding protein
MSCFVDTTIWAGLAEQTRTIDDEGPVMGVNNSDDSWPIGDGGIGSDGGFGSDGGIDIAPPPDLGQASVEDWLRSISQARSVSAPALEGDRVAGQQSEPVNTGTWETIPAFGGTIDDSFFELPELLPNFEAPVAAIDLGDVLDVLGTADSGSASHGSPLELTDVHRRELGLDVDSKAPLDLGVPVDFELKTSGPDVSDAVSKAVSTAVSDEVFSLDPVEPFESLGPIEGLESFAPPTIQVLAAPPGASVLFGDIMTSTGAVSGVSAAASPSVTSAFRQHLNDAAKVTNPGLVDAPGAGPVGLPESSVHVPSSPVDSPREIAVPTLPPLPATAPKSQPIESESRSDAASDGDIGFKVSPTVAKLPGTGSSVVAARNLTKVRMIGSKQVEILSDVTLDLRAGHFIVITGASGSGKTTLLSCLAGIDTFDRGELLFEGHALTDLTESDRARHRAAAMGFVFQGFHLVGVLTAVENVELPLLVAGWSAEEARDEAIAALSLVGLVSRQEQLPDRLSGGEQQRVAIARALVGEPRIVFADEPTGNLDDASARKIAHLFHELHADGLTVVVASHDQRLMALATTIVDVKDGRVTERLGPRTIV